MPDEADQAQAEAVEPEGAGDHGGVPADLVELHEIAEWRRAAAAGEGQPS